MLSHGSTHTHQKKIAALAGGCEPEASTLPSVSQFFSLSYATVFCLCLLFVVAFVKNDCDYHVKLFNTHVVDITNKSIQEFIQMT